MAENNKLYKNNQQKSTEIKGDLIGVRVPPHSEDAEIAVLGAMMLDKIAATKAIEILEPDSFYYDYHKEIFSTMVDMSEKGIPIDIVSISEELIKRKKLEFVKGTFYLTEINKRTPTAANVEFYARLVQEKFLKRQLIHTASKIVERSFDDSTDALKEIDEAEADIYKIAEKRFSSSFSRISELSHETMDIIQKLAERDKTGITGVPSGYTDLDKFTGGFQNSDLIIIAARPSMGKTAFALSIARNVAVEYNLPVAFFSIEMADTQLVIRLFSAESHVSAQKIRTGFVSEAELGKIASRIDKLDKSPLFIDDSPALSISEFRAKCRRLKKEHDLKLVVIDYLQLINPPKAESREREISMISSALKQIAKELNIPVIALAQLNRSVENRPDKKPLLSDLRESGSIEQDADVVLFIHRAEYYGIKTYPDNQQPTENTAEIIIGKQRNGPTSTVRLVYQKEYARFENGDFTQLHQPPDLSYHGSNGNDDDEPMPF
jgi:replicative DNA helicase